MVENVLITVANGDGIGPEIMSAVLSILKEAEAKITLDFIEVGEKLYNKRYASGIAEDTWDSIARSRVLLKAPITTPQGGGYKSLNVTLRKALSLYANIRNSVAYSPFIRTQHRALDVTIIRENEEDIYAGIEYRHTHNVYESMKLISRTGSEKIIRYAFDYAVKNGRKKVSCFSKDNIMKFSDGIFHKTFDLIAKEYPDILHEHYIIDIGTAKLATEPELFDVIVTSNLYGDIISDVAAEISGSVGLAGSSNIGSNYAMFEAVHGSAPDIAGQNIANPSGLLNAAIMMLIHIGHGETASLIENAWKKTIEDGIHTPDIYNSEISSSKVGTIEFSKAVIARLGLKPTLLKPANYQNSKHQNADENIYQISTQEVKRLVGCDIFVNINISYAHDLATKINELDLKSCGLRLQTISSKGLKLWPHANQIQTLSDHWCCRFMSSEESKPLTHSLISELLNNLSLAEIDFIKVENLYEFDGKRGFSLSQGE